jgi:hypothetical protein
MCGIMQEETTIKLDLILNLWKRDDYWLEECYNEVVDGNHWRLYAAHAKSDAMSRKGEEYERHFGIFVVTIGETDEVKCHGLINLGFCLMSTEKALIEQIESYREARNRPNNGISGYWPYEKVQKHGDIVFRRWLGRITCPSNQFPPR